MTAQRKFGWMPSGISLVVALLLVGSGAGSAGAQDVDARWLPWLGCWEAEGEGGEDSPMLCVRPLADGTGVELVSSIAGEVVSTESIVADGVPREAERSGCTGSEEAQFSDDGHRVYLRSHYLCEGGEERDATGLLAMLNPMEWIDIKVVGVQGERVPWALRYRLARASRVAEAGMENVVAARAEAVKEARIAASGSLSVNDLIEASGKVDPEAIETLVAERGDRFSVNADVLVQLADAGVPPDVIDLVIAVSYPDRFAVRQGAVEEVSPARRRGVDTGFYGRPYAWSFWNPYFYDPFFYGYSPYGYSPYFYGAYGYGGYGWGGYYGYYRPTTIVVQPRSTGGGHGTVVKGRGYTRGGSGGSGSSGRPVTRGDPASGSGGGVSSGGGGRSTGRVAKPRRGGGGGVL